MSWRIRCIENTIEITSELAKKIYRAQDYEDQYFVDVTDVTYDGRLQFNTNFCEHQDYLSNCPNIVEVLRRHKAKGVVTFQDTEQATFAYGDYWKHEFDGCGGYVFSRGVARIEWKVERAKK